VLSRRAGDLPRVLVQNHLLVRALMMAVAEHADDAAAREIGMKRWIGAAAVTHRCDAADRATRVT
jgi:hypothetical protein